MDKHRNLFLSGALLLTIAGLISKILSAMYRIPLQNLTGDLGFYLYQQIYPFIGTVMILSLYGFPVAVSKLTAERYDNKQSLTYREYFFPLLSVLLLLNGAFFLLVYYGAPYLAMWMNDPNMMQAIQMSAGLFLLIPFLALFRGVFQGEQSMKQTAYSQVIEQVVRVSIIVGGALFIFQGKLAVGSIAKIGVLASAIGMLIAIIMLAVIFFRRYPLHGTQEMTGKIPWYHYTNTIIAFGLFAALNHLTFIFIQFVDVMTFVPQLMKAGFATLEAMEQKGVFDRGLPLIQFGVVIGSSFALALIPTLAKAKTNDQAMRTTIQDAFAISFYLAAGATMGLITLMPEVNILLFKNEVGTSAIRILATSILLLSLAITGSAILQAQGHVRRPVGWLFVILAIKWVLNSFFIPLWGMYGAAISTVVSLTVFVMLLFFEIRKNVAGIRFFQMIRWQALGLASSGMVVYLLIVKHLIAPADFSRIVLLVCVIGLVASGALIYFIVLLRYRVFSEQQIAALPLSRIVFTLEKMVQKK